MFHDSIHILKSWRIFSNYNLFEGQHTKQFLFARKHYLSSIILWWEWLGWRRVISWCISFLLHGILCLCPQIISLSKIKQLQIFIIMDLILHPEEEDIQPCPTALCTPSWVSKLIVLIEATLIIWYCSKLHLMTLKLIKCNI